MKDRCDYRTMPADALLREAREQGINPEMAIALADHLAWKSYGTQSMVGTFHFNERTTK